MALDRRKFNGAISANFRSSGDVNGPEMKAAWAASRNDRYFREADDLNRRESVIPTRDGGGRGREIASARSKF
jgi:hypothetical protein